MAKKKEKQQLDDATVRGVPIQALVPVAVAGMSLVGALVAALGKANKVRVEREAAERRGMIFGPAVTFVLAVLAGIVAWRNRERLASMADDARSNVEGAISQLTSTPEERAEELLSGSAAPTMPTRSAVLP